MAGIATLSKPVGEAPRWVVALGVAVAAFAALPLVASIPAPLQDWPAHVARVHILDELLRGVGPWSRYYEFEGFLLPNVALDLGVLGLVRAGLPLGAAGAVFLLGVYAVFVAGFTRLSVAFGARSAATPMLGAIVFYNTALFWGFVNFSAALAVSFWVIAWWMGARRPGARMAVALLGSAATVACHIVPAVIVVGVTGLLDLTALARDWRRGVGRHCSSLVAAATVVAMLLLSPTGADGFAVGYMDGNSPSGFLHWKAQAYAKALLSGATWADVALVGLGAAIAVAIAVPWGRQAARLSIGRGGLVVVVALALLPLVAPERVGAGTDLDYRLAVLPFVFAAATIRVRFAGSRGGGTVFALVACLLILRMAALGDAWRVAGRTYRQAEAAFAGLPPGSILLAAYGTPARYIPWTAWWTPPMSHIDALGVPSGLIVPTVFAMASQQPLTLRPWLRPWTRLVRYATTPAQLTETLGQARLLCTSTPGVSLAVLYPAPFMTGPAFHAVNERLSIIEVCPG